MKSEISYISTLEKYSKWYRWIIPVIALLLYSNTIGHDFTQDDAIVIKNNIYTKKGFGGIKDLLINDTFNGFFKDKSKAKLVSGGRYRPLTPVMFAIEHEIFGYTPLPGHFINIISYAFLCFLIFITLRTLFAGERHGEHIAFLAALIYTIHPLHTEVVANIKSRDEIMAMLGSIGALWFILKYVETKHFRFAILGMLAFFLALMSKENAITFLAIIPLSLWMFRKFSLSECAKIGFFIFIPTVVFLMIRTSILGMDFGPLSTELMNNPYLKWNDSLYVPYSPVEKLASILFCFLKYCVLMIFPLWLTHDYYPNSIPLLTFSNPSIIFAMVLIVILGGLAFRNFKNRPILAFAILFFFATFSIVSNLFFPIGTNMSERFLFMPSLGFAIALAYLLTLTALKSKQIFHTLMVIIFISFATKTFARNTIWRDDYTIFTTDVKISKNSAKINASVAGSTIDKALVMKGDADAKKKMFALALVHANKALDIHPPYETAYLLKGNALYYLEQYDEAIQTFDQVLLKNPDFKDAFNNKAIALRDKGQYYGEKLGNIFEAHKALSQSYSMNPNDAITIRLLGVAEGMKGNHSEALKYFKQAVVVDPNNAIGYLNLGRAYEFIGKLDSANFYLNKAKALDSNIMIGK